MATGADLPYLRTKLLKWLDLYGRKFPWRETDDPYKILIAEIMLQRTQARQVAPIYERFIERFPVVESLAEAEVEEVKALVWSLGLPTRHSDLITVARQLLDWFGGSIPKTREELKRLTGVGDYIAGQVIAQGHRQNGWIVDTNVVRVFCRFFGLQLPGEARRSKVMIDLAQKYARSCQPHKANLALLDHAALICKPREPLCGQCPVRRRCSYYAQTKAPVPEDTGSIPNP
jgi:A/G-specific adenine glycosylase